MLNICPICMPVVSIGVPYTSNRCEAHSAPYYQGAGVINPNPAPAIHIPSNAVDYLAIKHALEKCLEDCNWQHDMEIVDIDNDGETVKIDNIERIQEINLALAALERWQK